VSGVTEEAGDHGIGTTTETERRISSERGIGESCGMVIGMPRVCGVTAVVIDMIETGRVVEVEGVEAVIQMAGREGGVLETRLESTMDEIERMIEGAGRQEHRLPILLCLDDLQRMFLVKGRPLYQLRKKSENRTGMDGVGQMMG
jgi:hypothetical protein